MTDVTRNGPLLWQAMLEELNVPGAVVAGGAVRDFCLNLEPKDIDIFVPVSCLSDFLALVDHVADNRYFDLHPMFDKAKEYVKDADSIPGSDLIGVMEGEAFGLPVNVIARTAHLGGPRALIDSFDFDVLQGYHDGESLKWNVCQGKACQTKIATLMHGRHVDQSIKRFLRFNQRHPGLLSLNIPFDVSEHRYATTE